jgi:Cu/Ag efflux pump CusA
VIARLHAKLDDVKRTLPPGVALVPCYDQSELVREATWTVKESLLIGGVLVVITLGLFLGNFRAAFIVAVRQINGPIQINREKNQRRWIVQGNVRGRDLGGVVADIRRRIADTVSLPPGYTVEYGGQFENQRRAMKRLSPIVPTVLALVVVMLWLSFGVMRHALIIIANVPLALVGGILGLLFTGEYLSVPAAVGFIALLGIAVQNGMVLVSCFNDLTARGLSPREAVGQGAEQRLRPVLMTALTTIFGLLPLLVARGVGAGFAADGYLNAARRMSRTLRRAGADLSAMPPSTAMSPR